MFEDRPVRMMLFSLAAAVALIDGSKFRAKHSESSQNSPQENPPSWRELSFTDNKIQDEEKVSPSIADTKKNSETLIAAYPTLE